MNLFLADELVNGLMVFVIGLLVVFFGMTIIVLVVSLIGKIMKATTGKEKPETKETKAEPIKVDAPIVEKSDVDEVDDKVKAAIFAAIAAYYFDMGSGCEFKVKRIKRI